MRGEIRGKEKEKKKKEGAQEEGVRQMSSGRKKER